MNTVGIKNDNYMIIKNIIYKNIYTIKYIPDYNIIVIFFITASPIIYIPINEKIL